MKLPALSSSSLKLSTDSWLPLVQARWRQARRQFDARLLNERRLIIVALGALVWFACDTFLITPGFAKLKAAKTREQTATVARDAMQAEINRKRVEMATRLVEAQREQTVLLKRLEEGQQDLERQQAMMAPAREMRALLEGLLAQNGQLRLRSMKTLPPTDVKFKVVEGMEGATPVLFSHGLEVSVSGSYMELVQWLRSVERLPRRLLWDSLSLASDEQAQLTLTLVVHTFSPDRDALEIAP